MDILKPFKALREKVSNKVEVTRKQNDDEKQLAKWVKKFEKAKAQTNLDLFDEREALVLGTRSVDRNINNGQKPTKGANNIYNICFEFIESQVNSQIPQPNVRSKVQGFETQAESIEQSLTNDLKEMGIEEVNDYNERMTPMHGYSVMTLDWDPDFKHHLYRGEMIVNSKHPKQIITQPGVYELQKMDYFFVVSGVSKDYIDKRYGVNVDEEQQKYPEYNSLQGRAQTINAWAPKGLTATGNATNIDNDLVTEVVCWYRDDAGDVGKFVWVDTTVCENLPKFYHRRMTECKECGHKMPVGEEECLECGSKKLKEITVEKQTLDMDVTISSGEVLPAGTEIPYFMPTRYPVIIRKNVPKSFSFEGQSDVDILRDQQDSIKKVGTKLEEKVVKAASILLIPDTIKQALTSESYQIFKGNPAELGQINVKDLTVQIGNDLQYIQEQRQVAQQMLGITNSYQGLQDVTAQSGRAKQVQVQQAAGRMQSKLFNKVTAFKQLFERMFEFKLAFYDELRPFLSKDANGAYAYGDFDKYKFLMRDSAGELYYCTDFLFSADSGDGLPKDPMFMYEQATNQYATQLINKVQYWTILESLSFPNAARFKDQAQKEMEAAANQPPQPTPDQQKAQSEAQLQQAQQQSDMQKLQAQQQADMQKQMNEQKFEIAKIGVEFNNMMQEKTFDAKHDMQKQLIDKLSNQGGGNNGEETPIG